MSLDELSKINTNLIAHLVSVIERERYQGVNDFFKYIFKEGDELMYFERGNVLLTIILKDNMIHIIDEVDKVEIEVPFDNKGKLNDMVKRFIIKKGRMTGVKTIEEILMEEFTHQTFSKALWKPYLVYDIETSLIKGDLRDTQYYLGYSFEEDAEGKGHYECIMEEDLPAFVQKMLDFDGYIVGFNNIYFDNPVCIYNINGTQEQIDQLNAKSIDLFVFIHQIAGKKVGLNKICGDLLQVTKTLDSGADVEAMWKEWKETGKDAIIEDVKKYCKNDVRMTTLLLFYLIYYKKLYIDGEDFLFEPEKLITHGKVIEEKKPVTIQEQSLF